MTESEKPHVMRLVAETLAAYGKALPEAAMAKAWLSNLAPYPLRIIDAALSAYRDENGEFAPVPAGIAKRCKLLDGRPGAEEAWAIALTSTNEVDTVVWTAECAEAFAICMPVLRSSGAISARKSFLEAYERLVGQARAEHRPTVWSASAGWDGNRRDQALLRATTAGLLSAPAAQPLLAGPGGSATLDDAARAQLAKVKQLLAAGAAARLAKAEAAAEARRAADRLQRFEWRRKVWMHFEPEAA